MTRRVVDRFAARPTAPVPDVVLDPLTQRETEVVRLVARGLSNDEIAATLQISPLTAKTHVTRALAKTGSRDRVQLVILADESRLVHGR